VFTGIVEETGTVLSATPTDGGIGLSIAADRVLEGVSLGDSIAVDGVCLTVTAFTARSFDVRSVATTLERTTLGSYGGGTRVNLERAVTAGQRLGGHLVQGHVDGVGEVVSIVSGDGYILIDFTLPRIVEEVTILHGSITLNGVSLTVNALPAPHLAQVSIIPHTWQVTALPDLRVGSLVNLEGDLIGRYVRHMLHRALDGGEANPGSADLLRSWGYK
jgi:riboflavin synthase